MVQPTTFALVRGADEALSVEEFTGSHSVRLDPVTCAIELAPVAGTSSPIVRWSRRFPETRELLSYAIRFQALDPTSPVRFEPSPDRRAVTLRSGKRDVSFDVEVTHVNRIGQQRILECGTIPAPAGVGFDIVGAEAG